VPSKLDIPLESPTGLLNSDERFPILKLPSSRSHSNIQEHTIGRGERSIKRNYTKSRSTVLFRPINDSKMEKYFKQARPGASIYGPVKKFYSKRE